MAKTNVKKAPRRLVSESKFEDARETLRIYFETEGAVSFQEAATAQGIVDRYLREMPERARREKEQQQERARTAKRNPKMF